MFKKLKELFGFPTEQEKAAAKEEVKVETTSTQEETNVVPFPTGDKPEAVAKVKKPRAAKPKAEKVPVEEPPAAKKSTAKKPAAKKPAAKKSTAKNSATRKAKVPVVGSGDVKQS